MTQLLRVTLWIIHVKVYLLKLHYITFDAFLVVLVIFVYEMGTLTVKWITLVLLCSLFDCFSFRQPQLLWT